MMELVAIATSAIVGIPFLFGVLTVAWVTVTFCLREWLRAFRQGRIVVKRLRDAGSSAKWHERAYGVLSFALADFGQHYETIEVINPDSGERFQIAYNG